MDIDIVDKLRMWETAEGLDSSITDELHNAADEIERLRAELAIAQKWRNNFKLAFEQERKNTEYWYIKAVNGE